MPTANRNAVTRISKALISAKPDLSSYEALALAEAATNELLSDGTLAPDWPIDTSKMTAAELDTELRKSYVYSGQLREHPDPVAVLAFAAISKTLLERIPTAKRVVLSDSDQGGVYVDAVYDGAGTVLWCDNDASEYDSLPEDVVDDLQFYGSDITSWSSGIYNIA